MENERYILAFGGSGWDCTHKQRPDPPYSEIPDEELPGSKGANQAVAAARAGYRVKMITIVGGDDVGKKIIGNFQNNNIDTSHVKVINGIKSDSCHIYVSLDGENDIIRSKEAIKKFTVEMVHENEDLIKNAQCVITHSKLPKPVYEELINFCYENGVPTFFTPCPAAGIDPEILKKSTYIMANYLEAMEVANSQTVEEALNAYPNLIITAGENGVFYLDENGMVYHEPAIRPEVLLDTTGAGDTFCGNFATALLKGYSKPDAVRRGVKAATLKLSSLGAQPGMPYEDDIDDFVL